MVHAFFSHVPWSRLPTINGPNLSEFRNSEDFYKQRFAVDSLYANFSQRTNKCHTTHPNATGSYKLRRQSEKETEDSLSQRSKVKRRNEPVEMNFKTTLTLNSGLSNANRKIDNSQINGMRLGSYSNSGSRAARSVKKKQGRKQQQSI